MFTTLEGVGSKPSISSNNSSVDKSVMFFGPPRQGQSFAEYESYMNMQNVAIGTGLVTLAVVINPIVAGALAVGWLISGPQKTKVKSSTQGG